MIMYQSYMIFVSYIVPLSCILITNKLASIIGTNRSKLMQEPFTPLPDIFHDILPITNVNVPDYLLVMTVIYLFFYGYNVEEYNPLPCIQSLLLRPFFVVSTTLPSCLKDTKNDESSYYNKMFVSSHDLMYSGHTIVFLSLGEIIGGSAGYIIQYGFPITLISSRQHYTIDVFVSFIVYHYFNN